MFARTKNYIFDVSNDGSNGDDNDDEFNNTQ